MIHATNLIAFFPQHNTTYNVLSAYNIFYSCMAALETIDGFREY